MRLAGLYAGYPERGFAEGTSMDGDAKKSFRNFDLMVYLPQNNYFSKN
jgi:hypothetical protein